MEACVTDILQDLENDDEGEYQEYVMSHSDYSHSHDRPPSTVTLDIITDACCKLAADESMPSEVREACQKCDKQEVFRRMAFLNECTVPIGRFAESSKEKAWSKFYAAVASDKAEELDTLLTPGVASFLSLEVFSMMLRPKANEETGMQIQDVTSREKDILSYIGGAVLQKLKQRAYRLRDMNERSDVIKCIQALTNEKAVPGSLTAICDRGGLVHLSTDSEAMFLVLESAFRQLFSGSVAQMSGHSFFEACHESVSASLYQVLYRFDDGLKEKMVKDVIFLYFKIRAHHKCKTFMDSENRRCHRAKKEKALRKRLK